MAEGSGAGKRWRWCHARGGESTVELEVQTGGDVSPMSELEAPPQIPEYLINEQAHEKWSARVELHTDAAIRFALARIRAVPQPVR